MHLLPPPPPPPPRYTAPPRTAPHRIFSGWSMEHMYAAYQSLLPHRYRLHKYKDHYHGPHFGLMNFRHESSTNSYDISIEILNHKGVPVMTSIIPIDVNKPNTKQQHSSGRKEKEKKYVCKPVRGELPYWRTSLYLIMLGVFFYFHIKLYYIIVYILRNILSHVL